jgi:hypothetical protein
MTLAGRGGSELCVHYAAFPLDAFHIEPAMVTGGPLAKGMEVELFCKLVRLILSCFSSLPLAPTAAGPWKQRALWSALHDLRTWGAAALAALRGDRLRVTLVAGDAITFCDTLAAAARCGRRTENI